MQTNILNANSAVFAAPSVQRPAAQPRTAQSSRSLYLAPPRFDVEGWIFIATLASFVAAVLAAAYVAW